MTDHKSWKQCYHKDCKNIDAEPYDTTRDGKTMISYCIKHWPDDRPFGT